MGVPIPNQAPASKNVEVSMASPDKQAVAEFEFENPVSNPNITSTTQSNQTSESIERQDVETVKKFLERPVRILTYTWAPTDAVSTEIFNYSFSNLLTVEPFASKLKGFRSLSADLKIKVTIAASPQQQGALYVKFLPLETNTDYYSVYNLHTRTLGSVSQLPGLTMTTCHKEAELNFPLRTPTGVIPLSNPTEAQYYWGKLSVWVLDTLKTGSGAGITTANISVYANLTNIKLGGPTIPQSRAPNNDKRTRYPKRVIPSEKEQADSSKTGVVSGPLIQVSRAANELSGIPLLSSFAKTTSWFSRALAGAASSFGFSKPVIQDPETAMMLQQHVSSFNCNQPETALVCSTFRDNSILLMDDIPGHNEDEMSIDYIKQQFAYYTTVSLTSSTNGAVITIPVSPNTFDTSFNYTNASGTVTVPTRTPIGFLSTLFTYWRGAIRIRIRIIKTKFHSGTFSIIWVPSYYTSSVTDSSQAYCYSHFVDISQCDEVEVTLPYMASSPFLPTTGSNRYSGTFIIRVINPIRYPDNVSSTVSLILEAYGGESLQFAVPTNTTPFNPTVVQSGMEEDCHTDFTNFVDKHDPHLEQLVIGEKVTSLRQLLLAYSSIQFNSQTGQLPTMVDGSVADPGLIGTTSSYPAATSFFPVGMNDLFSTISCCYLFQRGSIRYRFVTNATNGNVNIIYDISNVYNPTLPVNAGGFPVNLSTLTASQRQWRVASVSAQAGGGTFSFPYLSNNIFKVNIPLYTNATTTNVSYPQIKTVNGIRPIVWNTPSGTTGFISRAIGEDFQFGYWIGVPAG